MSRYTHLLFDLDGTLFDFEAAEFAAFKKTCNLLDIPYSDELMHTYAKINESYWKLFEQGKVSQPELSVRRFADLYTHLGLKGDANEANLCYRRSLAEGNQMFADTMPVCETLSRSYEIYLVTNGIAEVQRKRLAATPLASLLKGIFISEELGVQKPQKEFFDCVYDKLQISPRQALVIGDSLSSDIRGAQNSNTDSCWYNPAKKINTYSDLVPTYEIHALPELLELLSVKDHEL